jgi:ABC-type lipoprotein release transport system permease subunit
VFQPVKQQGLAASGGTTPFNLLFLGFSMFVIAAAAMLVALLFRLNVETRAREIGILRSVGFSAAKVRRLLLAEGAIVAALGGLLGLAVGVGYAWLMIAGLRTWWVSAISTPFLTLHMTAASYAIGYLAGLLIALGAIVWGLWQTRHVALRRLLAGEASDSAETGRSRTLVSRTVASVSLMLAVVTSLSAFKLSGEAQAGAFFGAGALVLTAALSFIWSQMRRASIGSLVGSGTGALAKLAARNAARHPSRSTLTVGLVASVSFIILAISAFQLQAPTTTDDRATGTGGFALVAESNQPIYQNLNSDDGRYDLGFRKSDDAAFLDAHAHVYAFRVYAGDDASCLNLYQPRQPRVLGVPDSFVERGGFAWGATALEADNRHPWNLLEDLPGDDYVVPVVLDYATAVYSLHLSGKPMEKFTITDGRGEKMTLMIVGLLQNSVFQGSLLISEQAFLRRFPDVSGYRFFLVDAPRDKAATVQGALDRALGDYGFDAEPASDRLAGYLAVQNTYLETFQSLGGLGLLLGTFGLATVQLRNVLERRGELALLRAVGFRRATLGILVRLENACLLVGGLAVGALAAIVALVPHLVGATEASIPWRTSAIMLSAIFVVGMLVGSVAVRAALRTPILSALREE